MLHLVLANLETVVTDGGAALEKSVVLRRTS